MVQSMSWAASRYMFKKVIVEAENSKPKMDDDDNFFFNFGMYLTHETHAKQCVCH